MKILKLVLRNFAAISKAMDADEISIDLSKCKNNICLLIGPNGSGKTTILSHLQPFADVGNLDVRNGNSLILSGKEGYKEIVIRKDQDIYTIKHFYSPHKDKNHSVKSYIMKNDTELNVNGNVTSFKELVKIELQIEPDYLKLIRLGSNVSSLISLSTTERKNFMSKTMDDISIFLTYYKNVNNKLHQLDDMISHNIDKLNKLDIVDKKDAKRVIDEMKTTLNVTMELYVACTNKQALLLDSIGKIDDRENIKSNLKTVTKKFMKMTDILEHKDRIESFEISYYEDKIRELELAISSLENEHNANIILIQNLLQHLNTLLNQYKTFEIQLKKEHDSDKEIKRMKDNLTDLSFKLQGYEEILNGFSVEFTKSEFETFFAFLKNVQEILRQTYEFGKPPVKKVISLMREQKNVLNYINKHLMGLDDNTSTESAMFISRIATQILTGNKEIVLSCPNECVAKDVFKELLTFLETKDESDKHESPSFYRDMELVYKNLSNILPRFADYKGIIDKLPDEIKAEFTIDKIYTKISKLDNIYDIKAFNDFESLVNEYFNYIATKEQYEVEERQLHKFAKLSHSSEVEESMAELSDAISETEDKIKDLKNRNSEINEEIRENKNTLETLVETKDALEKYDDIKVLYEKYTNDYALLKDYQAELEEVESSVRQYKFEIDNQQKAIQRKVSELDQFISISNELDKWREIYDGLSLTRDSLSAKQGIPLYFISHFLSNIEVLTNELLEIVYKGELFIDQFQITPTEFSIPFYNKGIRLDDVKYASQGELSFLSIALSFALASQVLNNYNIMLLDEIDGTLDTNNRSKFIKILESQIERIDSEQNFLITHNNMFSSYPVDIIDLSFDSDDTSNYVYANFVKIKRK